ncbi:MAG: hypothetical protein HQL28_02580 [Candidatus Omnitrophica bacterium]|nr:hypothetical protein [Candidatus Omnitrophota bacterium]
MNKNMQKHTLQDAKKAKRAMAAAFILIYAGLEAAFAFSVILTKNYIFGVALHCLGSGFLIRGVFIINSTLYKDKVKPVLFFGAIITAVFPIIGAAAFLLLAGLMLFGPKLKANVYGDYENYISEKGINTDIYGDKSGMLNNIREEVSFESYVNIVHWGDIASKMKVIGKLSDSAEAADIRLLREAVKDTSPEVRFYASGALLKLESSISSKISEMEETVKTRGSSADFARLGDLYAEYASSGLAPANLKEYYITLSAENYRRSLDINTDQPEVILNYVKGLFSTKEHRKAKPLLDMAIKTWPDEARLLLLRAEVYFLLWDMREMFFCLSGLRMDALTEEEKKVVEFWMS